MIWWVLILAIFIISSSDTYQALSGSLTVSSKDEPSQKADLNFKTGCPKTTVASQLLTCAPTDLNLIFF